MFSVTGDLVHNLGYGAGSGEGIHCSMLEGMKARAGRRRGDAMASSVLCVNYMAVTNTLEGRLASKALFREERTAIACLLKL